MKNKFERLACIPFLKNESFDRALAWRPTSIQKRVYTKTWLETQRSTKKTIDDTLARLQDLIDNNVRGLTAIDAFDDTCSPVPIDDPQIDHSPLVRKNIERGIGVSEQKCRLFRLFFHLLKQKENGSTGRNDGDSISPVSSACESVFSGSAKSGIGKDIHPESKNDAQSCSDSCDHTDGTTRPIEFHQCPPSPACYGQSPPYRFSQTTGRVSFDRKHDSGVLMLSVAL